jgi:L-ascorbate metabolism protein UlaG (beta-lactamase superfamily)
MDGMRACAAIVCSVLLGWTAPASRLRVIYLANEGVLIEGGGKRFLVDALFRDSLGTYARHSPAVQEQMETGKPPFDRISLALATHYHLDHWDAGAISRFLRHNPEARFASTPTATGMMPSAVRNRVIAAWPVPSKRQQITPEVEAFALEHGRTENLGYRIEVGGRSIIHVGDADPSSSNFRILLQFVSVDIAMVPWWWLTEQGGVEFLNRWKPKQLVALHAGEDDLAAAEALRSARPDVWICTRQGEVRVF